MLSYELFSIAYLSIVAKKVKFYSDAHVLLCCYVVPTLHLAASVENLLATAFYLEMRRPKTLKLFGYFLKRYKSSLRPYSLSKSFVLLCKARTALASAAFLVFYSLAKALIPNGMC